MGRLSLWHRRQRGIRGVVTERQRQLLAPIPMSAAEVADLVHRTRVGMARASADSSRAAIAFAAEQRRQIETMRRDMNWMRWMSRCMRRRIYQRAYRAKLVASCR